MIDSIKKIGKERSEPFLKSLVIGMKARVEKPLLMKLIFSFDEKKIIGDFIELDDSRLREYYWVGNAEGNLPQNRLTTDKLDYLINLNKKRSSYNIIQDIKNFWRGQKIPGVIELQSKLEKIEEEFFGNAKRARKSCEEAEKERSPYKNEIVLYTVCIKEKGKIEELAKTEWYEKFLEHVFLRPHEAVEGRCHVCGEKKNVLSDPAFRGGSILKIYVTDKKGFTSGIADTDEARLRTFSVCLDCLRELLAGENYIQANLRDQLGRGFGVYLIPKGVRLRKLDTKMKDCIRGAFGAVKGFEGLQGFERRLEREFRELYKGLVSENACLDLIFGGRAQAKFDFKYHIQDVPILRLEMLRREMSKIAERASELLGGNKSEWGLGFQEIREIFPLRVQRGKVREWKVLLEFFSAMINKTPYPKHLILKRAMMLARIHRFGVYEPYGMRKPRDSDSQLVGGTLKYNLLLRLLHNIGCLSMEDSENLNEGIPTEVRQWWNEVRHDDKQKALFLLGYLVGKVGTEQFKKGDKKKAILNRINFDGMLFERVVMLANSILKSLRDYRILSGNETIYASMKSLLDKTVKELEDPIENLFHILSGYAFSTRMAMIKGGEKE
jgi:CRISPR-associated protein Csh1